MKEDHVDSVEEVPCPRDGSKERNAHKTGTKQRAPAAVTRVPRPSSGGVPTYSQADGGAKTRQHDDEAEVLERVAVPNGHGVWG